MNDVAQSKQFLKQDYQQYSSSILLPPILDQIQYSLKYRRKQLDQYDLNSQNKIIQNVKLLSNQLNLQPINQKIQSLDPFIFDKKVYSKEPVYSSDPFINIHNNYIDKQKQDNQEYIIKQQQRPKWTMLRERIDIEKLRQDKEEERKYKQELNMRIEEYKSHEEYKRAVNQFMYEKNHTKPQKNNLESYQKKKMEMILKQLNSQPPIELSRSNERLAPLNESRFKHVLKYGFG